MTNLHIPTDPSTIMNEGSGRGHFRVSVTPRGGQLQCSLNAADKAISIEAAQELIRNFRLIADREGADDTPEMQALNWRTHQLITRYCGQRG